MLAKALVILIVRMAVKAVARINALPVVKVANLLVREIAKVPVIHNV